MSYYNDNNVNGIVTCFVQATSAQQVQTTVAELRGINLVGDIYLLCPEQLVHVDGCKSVVIDALQSSATIRAIAHLAKSAFTLIYTKLDALRFGYHALERMVSIASDSDAAMFYADHYHIKSGVRSQAPVADYQKGSLRDDFDFGSVLLFKTEAFCQVASGMTADYKAAGLYDLRLRLSQNYGIVRINEYLYTDIETDTRTSGQKIYDYCDPRNSDVQLEMEQACTEHLKAIGAYLAPGNYRDIDFAEQEFPVEASVVIPVLNRVRVISDAIKSVLTQECDFKFNLIVVDNHSTDGTTEAIDEFAADERLVHIIPERDDLGIGGCWNLAAHDPRTGRFIIGLDSDDVYATPSTLATMIAQFYADNCAMVCGTYRMTDFNMNEIAPGVIDHHEWTADNGRNNALHVNGFGGPRAFYTPVYRAVGLPNTSYGEDYAMGLMISRHYRIGRVWTVMTNARRWDDNTDADLDVVKDNANNLYKDRIRTWEIEARIKLNKALQDKK